MAQPSFDSFPSPSRQPLAVDFIENRDTDLRDSTGELPCVFDVGRQRFVPKTASLPHARNAMSLTDVELEESNMHLIKTTESFADAIKKLTSNKSQNSVIKKFSLSACDNWEEVMRTMDLAAKQYESRDSKSGKFRSAFRKFSDHSASIKAFVGLLPDGNYKTLCGGLTLILTAMMGHKELREKMASLLEEIPDTVIECEKYSNIYQGNNSLRACINEIHVHLLMALGDVIHWYGQSSAKRVRDSLLKNDVYGQSIDVHINKIEYSKRKFMREAFLYLAARAKVNLEVGLDTNAGVHILSQKADMLMEILVDQGKNAQWNKEVEEERQKMAQEYEAVNKEKDDKIRRLSNLVYRTSNTPETLMVSLELNSTQAEHNSDLRTVLAFGLNESLTFQGRSGYIGKANEFRDWMNSNRSAALFIQGHGDFEKMTPTSYFITLLRESIQKLPNTLALSFFCGLHTDGGISGPAIMAKTIFGQALALNAPDDSEDANGDPLLSFLGVQDVQKMQADNYDTYLSSLAQLLPNIRRRYSAIFIMVDSVDFYDEKFEEEIWQFISEIKKLIKVFNKSQKQENGGVLKLLMTASSQSSCFSHSSRSSVTMHMPEEIDGDEDKFEEFVRSSDKD
ncbi:hypothetical protein HBI75_193840 [Parastagonospora nodorum]|nr:hypothetical protein HBI75_193840 [Parastagonospora nodorum]KAH5124180.1 hypothetical protein HBH71_012800 [Parastagonospora nodorum]KAH5276631.1 hypothetical protein HBI71_036310 [Parastagonospora nodorum]